MITTIISLITALAVVAIVYILLKWIIGKFSFSSPITQIVDIVFGVIAVIMVLRYLVTLI